MGIVAEWIVIGFFSAVGWKGADVMFEKLEKEPTSISKKLEKKEEVKPPTEKKDDS